VRRLLLDEPAYLPERVVAEARVHVRERTLDELPRHVLFVAVHVLVDVLLVAELADGSLELRAVLLPDLVHRALQHRDDRVAVLVDEPVAIDVVVARYQVEPVLALVPEHVLVIAVEHLPVVQSRIAVVEEVRRLTRVRDEYVVVRVNEMLAQTRDIPQEHFDGARVERRTEPPRYNVAVIHDPHGVLVDPGRYLRRRADDEVYVIDPGHEPVDAPEDIVEVVP